MEDYAIDRTAIRLTQKYGKKALPKAVEVAKYYLGEADDENAKRWVKIGYSVKKLLQMDVVDEVLKEAEEV